MNEYMAMIPTLSDKQLLADAVDCWPAAWAGKAGAVDCFRALRSEAVRRGLDLSRVPGPAGRALRAGA